MLAVYIKYLYSFAFASLTCCILIRYRRADALPPSAPYLLGRLSGDEFCFEVLSLVKHKELLNTERFMRDKYHSCCSELQTIWAFMLMCISLSMLFETTSLFPAESLDVNVNVKECLKWDPCMPECCLARLLGVGRTFPNLPASPRPFLELATVKSTQRHRQPTATMADNEYVSLLHSPSSLTYALTSS